MKHQRGLSLLELLIAITLLGFIVALLFAGFRLASTSWDKVNEHAARTADEQLARATLERIIASIQPLRWAQGSNRPLAFIGEPQRLAAVGPLTVRGEASGLRVFEISRSPDDGMNANGRLTIRQAPVDYGLDTFDGALGGVETRTLLDAVTDARFAYFGSDDGKTSPAWHDQWPDPSRMPELIRLQIHALDDGWSDVVIAPKISGGNCTLDLAFKLRCT